MTALNELQPECGRCGLHHDPGWPHDLQTHGGDSKLDTPLCYEINRLAPPSSPPDAAYDRLLMRWFGEGWETR